MTNISPDQVLKNLVALLEWIPEKRAELEAQQAKLTRAKEKEAAKSKGTGVHYLSMVLGETPEAIEEQPESAPAPAQLQEDKQEVEEQPVSSEHMEDEQPESAAAPAQLQEDKEEIEEQPVLSEHVEDERPESTVAPAQLQEDKQEIEEQPVSSERVEDEQENEIADFLI